MVLASLWGLGSDEHAFWDDQVAADKRLVLLNYVQRVQPSMVTAFEGQAPAAAVDAMRSTVARMLGHLPPQVFKVMISSRDEHMAQLMYNFLMTGFMFCNGWMRLDLARRMGATAAAPPVLQQWGDADGGASAGGSEGRALVSLSSVDEDAGLSSSSKGGGAGYAPGSQKIGVQGEVLRWHHELGSERIPALDYIEQLESELASLRRQVAAAAREVGPFVRPPVGNELTDYLKGLSPGQLAELTESASPDVLEAMNSLVQRLMSSDGDWADSTSDCTAAELAQLLYWLQAIGWQMRQLELRLDMQSSLDLPLRPEAEGGSSGLLPPGR